MNDQGGPFRILVLADFSGRASRGVATPGGDIARRRLLRVDKDSFGAAMRSLVPEVKLAGGRTLRFASPDDLRPEALVAQVPEAAELLRLRERLFDARSAAAAAEEARALLGTVAAEPPSTRPAQVLPSEGVDLLGSILDGGQPVARGDEIADLVRDVARPGVERLRVAPGPSDRALLAALLDARLGSVLRTVLHDPAFRAFEASWRGVEFLVRRLDLGAEAQVHLLDVSRDEALADVGVSGGFDASGLHRVIVEDTVGSEGAPRWSLVVADWRFGATARDVAGLLRLAKLARAAEAALVAGAEPGVVGCRSLGATPDPEDWDEPGDASGRELWSALRRMPEAGSVALAWPRLLLRAPYGANSDVCEGPAFEEFDGAPDHELLAWGNGAFAVAMVLGRAAETGDAPDPEIDGLAAVVVERDGGRELVPCAETWLATRGLARAAAAGLLPLVSVKGTASVRLGNLDFLTDPRTAL